MRPPTRTLRIINNSLLMGETWHDDRNVSPSHTSSPPPRQVSGGTGGLLAAPSNLRWILPASATKSCAEGKGQISLFVCRSTHGRYRKGITEETRLSLRVPTIVRWRTPDTKILHGQSGSVRFRQCHLCAPRGPIAPG